MPLKYLGRVFDNRYLMPKVFEPLNIFIEHSFIGSIILFLSEY